MVVQIIQIALLVFRWVYGAKLERAARAKEIVDTFRRINSEGDVLADQLHVELSRHSDVDWTDIEVRKD